MSVAPYLLEENFWTEDSRSADFSGLPHSDFYMVFSYVGQELNSRLSWKQKTDLIYAADGRDPGHPALLMLIFNVMKAIVGILTSFAW